MLTPVFAQSSPHRSRESVAVVRSVPIQIGPPSSSEGRERTVFSCLRDYCVGVVCAHYVCHTIWRKLRVFRDFLRIFRRKPPVFYSFLPAFRRLLSCHGHSLHRWWKGAADRRCDVCCAGRPPTGLASALGGGEKCRPECRAPSERARRCERGQPTSCCAEMERCWVQFAERAPVASRRYTKKTGRRKVYVCRREEVQCSAVRNRASRGARLITPSRVCGFSACH